MSIRIAALLFVSISAQGWSQSAPDFSGVWKQDNDRCLPKRSGDVTLRVEQSSHDLTIKTLIAHGAGLPRHAIQKYTTDGKVSVSTGADGDEFHTSVIEKDATLIFAIEEHEDGRILHSQETWSLLDNGSALQRTRERPGGETQILIFRHPTAATSTQTGASKPE
jgi:hypothetical protein